MDDDREEGAVIVASEPLSKDPGWKAVPPNYLLSVDEHLSVAIEAI
jgi:predicted glutamine amidotransferase